jgi:protein-S-isoprenylcysteine O-methyltransferase Ste14
MLYIIISDLMQSTQYTIFMLPYLLANTAMLVMVVLSSFNKPKDVSDSNMVFLVSIMGGNLPVITHFLGINLMSAQRFMPLANVAGLASVLLMPFYLAGIFTLGRNLTVLPEANELRVTGVYKISRHPLYFCYICWYILQILICQSWIIIFLSIVQIAFQLQRAKNEEIILEKNFPEYTDYKAKTSWFWK